MPIGTVMLLVLSFLYQKVIQNSFSSVMSSSYLSSSCCSCPSSPPPIVYSFSLSVNQLPWASSWQSGTGFRNQDGAGLILFLRTLPKRPNNYYLLLIDDVNLRDTLNVSPKSILGQKYGIQNLFLNIVLLSSSKFSILLLSLACSILPLFFNYVFFWFILRKKSTSHLWFWKISWFFYLNFSDHSASFHV